MTSNLLIRKLCNLKEVFMDFGLTQKREGPSAMVGECRSPTLSERLEEKKERLTKQLGEVNRAIEVLKKFPEVKEVVDVISRLNY